MSESQSTPQERYQYKPFVGSSHTWALSQLSTLPTSARVLDVGIGDAMLARTLKSNGITQLWGVDIDAAARAAAKDVYVDTYHSVAELENKTFDVILLLDVLEHMADPFAFFAEAVGRLSPGGTLLVSVPNVAHWSLRLSLAFGIWQYTERGLLDKTHLHFFTRRHFFELLASQKSLVLKSSAGSISPAEFVLPKWISGSLFFRVFSNFRWHGAQLFPGLCAYQHLARLERGK
jgi:2-polyprenyl-3-methyl-5-hydroxy-6-metoxy-1,4-benzoquinol methylase